jgi:lysyl-tRNA synthetase class II
MSRSLCHVLDVTVKPPPEMAHKVHDAESSGGKRALNLSLGPNSSVTVRNRVLISSEIVTPENTEAAYQRFIAPCR